MNTSRKTLISAAVCGLVSLAARAEEAAMPSTGGATGKTECQGVNACKGQTDCHTAENACAGANSCKGKGWKAMSKADCDKAQAASKPKETKKK